MKNLAIILSCLLLALGGSNILVAQSQSGKVTAIIKSKTSDKKLQKIKKRFNKKNVQFDIVGKARNQDGDLTGIKLYLNSHDGFEAKFSYSSFNKDSRIKIERNFKDPENPIFIGLVNE